MSEMLTSYIIQTPEMNKEKRYKILFETPSYERFKFVEDACGKTIRNKTQAEWDKRRVRMITTNDKVIKEWDDFYCGNCGVQSTHPSNYCPNCGTKMSTPTEASDDR